MPWRDADDGPPSVRAVERPTAIGRVGDRPPHMRTVLIVRVPSGELLTVREYEDGRTTLQVGYWRSIR